MGAVDRVEREAGGGVAHEGVGGGARGGAGEDGCGEQEEDGRYHHTNGGFVVRGGIVVP